MYRESTTWISERASGTLVLAAAAILGVLELLSPTILMVACVAQTPWHALLGAHAGLALGSASALFAPTERTLLGCFAALAPALLGLGLVLATCTSGFPILVAAALPFALIGGLLAASLVVLPFPRALALWPLGTALGMLLGALILPHVGGESLWLALAALSAILTVACLPGRRAFALALLPAVIAVGLLNWQAFTDRLNLLRILPAFAAGSDGAEVPAPALAHLQLREGDTRLIESRWSLLGRVDVLDCERHPPDNLYADLDLSPTCTLGQSRRWNEGQRSVNLYYDSVLGGTASQWHYLAPAPWPDRRTESRALVLDSGGSDALRRLLKDGACPIVAAGVPAATVELMRGTLSEVSGKVFDSVDLVPLDGRTYLRSNPQPFDRIELGNADRSLPLPGSAVCLEDYLYTVEAFGEYLDHLAPEGVLRIGRWFTRGGEGDALARHASTAAAALRRCDLEPSGRIAILRTDPSESDPGGAGFLFVKRERFRESELEHLLAIATAPGENLYLDLGPSTSQPDTDHRPPTDDNPGRDRRPLRSGVGFPGVHGALLLTLAAAALLMASRTRMRRDGGESNHRAALACALAGAAVPLMLGALIHRMHLPLGMPVWTAIAITVAFLLGTAAGARSGAGSSAARTALLLAGAALLAGITASVGPPALTALSASPGTWSLFILAALCLLLGSLIAPPLVALLGRVTPDHRAGPSLGLGLFLLGVATATAALPALAAWTDYLALGGLGAVLLLVSAAAQFALHGDDAVKG